jgi:hypothetical protein
MRYSVGVDAKELKGASVETEKSIASIREDRGELFAAIDQLTVAIAALGWAVDRAKERARWREATDEVPAVEERMPMWTPKWKQTAPKSKSEIRQGAISPNEEPIDSAPAGNEEAQWLAIEAVENAFAQRMLRTDAAGSSPNEHMKNPASTTVTRAATCLGSENDQTEITTVPTAETMAASALTDEEDPRSAIESAFAESFLPVRSARKR